MTDDDPLDLTQVAADSVLLDGIRLRSVPADDSAISLLCDLLADVERDLPVDQPVGVGSTVLRLADDFSPDPRLARSGTVVAFLAAGLVALGGVAAASTAVAPGNPLHGLGEAVRSAAAAVVTAVTPPESSAGKGSPAAVLPEQASDRAVEVHATRPSAAAPGPQVADVARSAAAARQLTALLDSVGQLLADGRAAAADARLQVAERRITEVADADAPALRSRMTSLRAQVDAALAEQPPGPAPRKEAAVTPAKPSREAPAKDAVGPESASQQKAAPTDAAAEPVPAPDAVRSDLARDAVESRTTGSRGQLRQPSRLASTNPRA